MGAKTKGGVMVLDIISLSITVIGNTVLFFMIKHDLKNKRRRDDPDSRIRKANPQLQHSNKSLRI